MICMDLSFADYESKFLKSKIPMDLSMPYRHMSLCTSANTYLNKSTIQLEL
jgi:hypothetical protein